MNKTVNRSNMRILLILMLLICSFLNLPVEERQKTFAEPSQIPGISVESKTVHRGKTFEVKVDLTNNVGLISLFLTLDYDSNVMKLSDVIQGEALSSLTMTTTNHDTEEGYSIRPFNILWDGKDKNYQTGTIVTLIFDSNIDAPIGDYPVTLTYDKKNTNTEYRTPIDVDITNGVITLTKGEYQTIYRDHDGDILYEKDYNEEDIPSFPYEDPSREDDDEYSYEFIGFKGVVSEEENTIVYEAQYRYIPKVYNITYYIDGINGEPDGIVDENDYFMSVETSFGTYIELPEVPRKQYYEFFGWYEDKYFSTTSNYVLMPAKDIRLYGYYSFDVRTNNIPIITLNNVEITGNEVVITAELLKNTGLNGLILTLNYDRDVLEFNSFENLEALSIMQFDTTNLQNIQSENFKFYYEFSENIYNTGNFLKLYFTLKQDIDNGIYNVWFDYDYHSDATYITTNHEIKYTMVEFQSAYVPVGAINHWNATIEPDREIDVTSEDPKPINTVLEINLVTERIRISDELVEAEVGKGMYLSSAYDIKLLLNGEEIEPDTVLTIKVKLTETEKNSNLKFYYLSDGNNLTNYDFEIKGDYLVFKTDHLSNWLVFSDYNKYVGKDSIVIKKRNAMKLIGYPLILASVTMIYSIRLKQLSNKKKEAHDE